MLRWSACCSQRTSLPQHQQQHQHQLQVQSHCKPWQPKQRCLPLTHCQLHSAKQLLLRHYCTKSQQPVSTLSTSTSSTTSQTITSETTISNHRGVQHIRTAKSDKDIISARDGAKSEEDENENENEDNASDDSDGNDTELQQQNKKKFPPMTNQELAKHWRIMERVGEDLGVTRWEDWYKLGKRHLRSKGGRGLLLRYQNVPGVLRFIYPNYPWAEWKFESGVPAHFWDDFENHKRFMTYLGEQLNIQNMEQWYFMSREIMSAHGGAGLLQLYYGCVPSDLIRRVFSDYEWLPWKFSSGVSVGYWDDLANHKQFMQYAGTQMGIKHMEEWYAVTSPQINELGGAGLLRMKYNGSVATLIQTVYSEYPWLPWKFIGGTPGTFWETKENVKRYFEWLIGVANLESVEEIATKPRRLVTKYHGAGLLAIHGQVLKALELAFPEKNWRDDALKRKPKQARKDTKKRGRPRLSIGKGDEDDDDNNNNGDDDQKAGKYKNRDKRQEPSSRYLRLYFKSPGDTVK